MERNNLGFPNSCWGAIHLKEKMTKNGQHLTGE